MKTARENVHIHYSVKTSQISSRVLQFLFYLTKLSSFIKNKMTENLYWVNIGKVQRNDILYEIIFQKIIFKIF